MNRILLLILKFYALFPMRMLSIGALKITFFLRLFEYRKSVINQNLKLSFPEKSKQEIRKIKNEFYWT